MTKTVIFMLTTFTDFFYLQVSKYFLMFSIIKTFDQGRSLHLISNSSFEFDVGKKGFSKKNYCNVEIVINIYPSVSLN